MSWLPPPADDPTVPLRQRNAPGWRIAIELIARKHGIFPCDLEPYEKGETIVWRAGDHVIKLTLPQCAYQIEAEVGCLRATHGKLSVGTPSLYEQGELSGWPYVIMTRIGGKPLADFWPSLAHEDKLRLAGSLGKLCRELHALPPHGFPLGWDEFWREHTANLGARHAAHGGPPALLANIEPYSETLLAWCLCHRFNNLNRLLALVAPWVPDSLEALAARLYALGRD